MITDVIAGAALAVSIGAGLVSYVNYLVARDAERRARMPVLVFLRDEPGLLTVANVGNGPALNVVIAGSSDETVGQPVGLRRSAREAWWNPTHLTPLRAGGGLQVSDPGAASFGAYFTDVLGHMYTVKTSPQGTLVLEGRHLPH